MEPAPIIPLKTKKNYTSIGRILIIILLIFITVNLVKIIKPMYRITSLPQTAGINAHQNFQFTLSPDNKWIIYSETKFPYYDQFNIIAFNTVTKEKYNIDTGSVNTGMMRLSMKNDCWSIDSKYCVFNNLGELIVIDFNNTNGPILKSQYLDNQKIYSITNVTKAKLRLALDQISPAGFTCADCTNQLIEKDFGDNSHGYELTSPNGKYIVKQISYSNGWMTPPYLYFFKEKTSKKIFIAKNVYYDMHFTSDSSGLYYYACHLGGACDKYRDHLYFVDFTDRLSLGEKIIRLFKKNASENIVPQHTLEEETQALNAIVNNKNTETEALLKSKYDFLVSKLSTPQEIIGLNILRLFTADHIALLPINHTEENTETSLQNMDEFSKSLMGKTVNIKLPPFDSFKETYEEFSYGNDEDVWIYDLSGNVVFNGKAPVDPATNVPIGTIRVDIYSNEVRLNNQFK